MFFDVFEVSRPSWNDSGWILDHSFFHHFLTFFVIIFLPSLYKNSSVYPNKHGFEAADFKFNIFSNDVFDINES